MTDDYYMVNDYYTIDDDNYEDYDDVRGVIQRRGPVLERAIEEPEEDETFGNNKIINFILEQSPFDDERITFAVASVALFIFVSESIFRTNHF